MIEAAEIERMSMAERLQAMELLWRSMSGSAAKVQSPSWHKEVLDQRMTRIAAGQAKFLTVAQLKRRLAKRKP